MKSVVQPIPTLASPAMSRGWQWRAYTSALVAGDALVVTAALLLAFAARFQNPWLAYQRPYEAEFYFGLIGLMVPMSLALFALGGLYKRQNLLGGTTEYSRAISASSLAILAVIVLSFLVVHDSEPISRGWLSFAWLFLVGLVCLHRFGLRQIVYRLRERGLLTTRALIVGANEEARALSDELRRCRWAGVELLGLVALAPSGSSAADELTGARVVADVVELAELVDREQVEELIVASTALQHEQLLELFRQFATDERVEIRLSSGLFELLMTGMRVQEIASVPLVSLNKARLTGLDVILKRSLDLGLALASAIVVLPLMLVLGLAVRLDSPGPVIHRRRVLGLNGRPFEAFKLRTMAVDAERRLAQVLEQDPVRQAEWERGQKLRNDPRLTRLGPFLRRYSLDELPQWLNVLRGEMSFVGPRMVAVEEAMRYGRWRFNLLTVKPGLTGPWQVMGRNSLPYEERVRLSMNYIRNYSIWLDLRILFRTIPVVLRGDDAY
jgi:exopolysaccharide biosynthesis polyprenyl glycosylphosphotransferase